PCASPVSTSAGSWRITKPPWSRRPSTARMVPRIRGSSGGRKPVVGDQQQAAVEPLRAIGLHEASQLGVEAVAADVVVNLPRHRAPALDRPLQPEVARELGAAVEGDPRHDLAEGEMARRRTAFPDAAIGLAPDRRQVRQEGLHQVPGVLAAGDAAAARLVERVHDLAIDVYLELGMRAVADANR